MKLKEYILGELAFRVLSETVKELNSNINADLGDLARRVLEEPDEKRKEDLINRYNKLKQLDNLDMHNIDVDDLDYKIKKVLNEKIRSTVPTIINNTIINN